MQLNDRKKQLLEFIVNLYIETGEPVGSKLLASASGMNLSTATLRNEMSELAEMGYLEQPHTSAGRIPSQLGYRTYVDSLMTAYLLSGEEKGVIEDLLKIDGTDLESLLEKAGEVLAAFTGCAAVSAVRQTGGMRLRRVELLPAGRRSVLLVVLLDSGVIKSRLCRAGDDLSGGMLQFFTRLLGDRLGGKTPAELTPQLRETIAAELYEYTYALTPVLDTVFEEIGGLSGSEVFVGGETNLLKYPGMMGERALDMIRFLRQREDLAALVEGIREGVLVRIGSELGPDFLQQTSLIAAPYQVGGVKTGAIGIIGPSRMNYSRLVSSVEYFSTVLSRLISDMFSD